MIFPTMMRPIALAAILGALLAAGAFYAAGESGWRNAITVWLGASERAPTAALTSEDWPTCTVMGSMIGSEADWARLDPDFAAGKKALVAEDWNGAIAALKLAALRDPRNADIQNYIGYAYRRLPYDGHTLGTVIPQMPGQAVSGTVVARVVASQNSPAASARARRITACDSRESSNRFARKSRSKGQNPANSIT